MGQYHYTVNLTKREFLDPHKLGDGLKLLEQCGWSPGGINDALHLLLACSSGRGGGDFQSEEWVGRWAGDQIAVVGDYAEDEDLAPEHKGGSIYSLCSSREDIEKRYKADEEIKGMSKEEAISKLFCDITDDLIPILEREYEIIYAGDGWKDRINLSEMIQNYQGSHGIGDRIAIIGGESFKMSNLRKVVHKIVSEKEKRDGELFTLAELKSAGLKKLSAKEARGF